MNWAVSSTDLQAVVFVHDVQAFGDVELYMQLF